MREIAVFYHVGASWDAKHSDRPVTGAWRGIVRQQVAQWRASGLLDAATHFFVGVNGTTDEFTEATALLPQEPKLVAAHWGQDADWEMPTLNMVRDYAIKNPEALVFYHHTKGASDDTLLNQVWRFEMQHYTVALWRECVGYLRKGYDIVGTHWLTPKEYPQWVKTPFFAGTFWWARASYVATLPELVADWTPKPMDESGRYAAERWIGKGCVNAWGQVDVFDWQPGWPHIELCQKVTKYYEVPK